MKTNNCRLSVIIPYKNKVKYLEKLLESIAAEADFSVVQVIVADDRSTEQLEKFEELIRRYEGVVEFCRNESLNPGAGAGRNAGLKKAKGEWLLFADTDDYFVSGWYQKVAACYDDPADIICFIPVSAYEDTGLEAKRHVRYERLVNQYLKERNEETEDRLRYEYLVPWSKMIRRSLVAENGIVFDEVMHANDNMFSVRCGAAAKEITAVKEHIYCAVDRQDSLTKNLKAEVLYQREQVRSRRYNFVKQKVGNKRFQLLDISALGIDSMARIFKLYLQHQCSISSVKDFLTLLRKENVSIFPSFRYICANAGRLYRHFFKGEIY